MEGWGCTASDSLSRAVRSLVSRGSPVLPGLLVVGRIQGLTFIDAHNGLAPMRLALARLFFALRAIAWNVRMGPGAAVG